MATKDAQKYIESIGRRKSATARVRITESSKSSFKINDKNLEDYFSVAELIKIVEEPLKKSEVSQKFIITVKVLGGGIKAQAEAIRLGLARAIEKFQPELRKVLKKEGLLKRDARVKERKKPGLKKARKRPQWSKR